MNCLEYIILVKGDHKDSRHTHTHLEGTEDATVADTAAVFNLSETSPEQIQVSQETTRKGGQRTYGACARNWDETEGVEREGNVCL